MRRGAAPLRFLALVIGGWVCARAAFLSADWFDRDQPDAQQAASPIASAIISQPSAASTPPQPTAGPADALRAYRQSVFAAPLIPRRLVGSSAAAIATPLALSLPVAATSAVPAVVPVPGVTPLPVTQPALGSSRWTASAWLFLRDGGGGQLAPAGTLGGSQVGGRLSYRLGAVAAPLAVSGRFYSPTRDLDEAEAALGIEWQPSRAVPVRLLAERRQALGEDGRSAFALMAYGGVSDQPVGPLRLESYAQAGIVGLRSRDLFADGSVRLLAPIAAAPELSAGAGLWGAAQPGVSRLDAGPALSLRIAPNLRAVAEWRLRIAGEAEPDSGPALTLGADF